MLRTLETDRLSEGQLREALLAALNGEFGAKFILQEGLFDKLEAHGVSDLDLLHVCKSWQVLRESSWDGSAWRYRIEGDNLDGKWMAVVLAVYINPIIAVAITGFQFSRGRRKI